MIVLVVGSKGGGCELNPATAKSVWFSEDGKVAIMTVLAEGSVLNPC
jgi:hypothetical protein